jgi:hypothetical protein
MLISLSTRSGGANLALSRPGIDKETNPRRIATLETNLYSIVAMRRKQARTLIPALKRRAKFAPTLRVEGT